jgi:hypothetical protein
VSYPPSSLDAMKRCSRCKEMKALHEFQRTRARRDGVQTYCRVCKRLIDREHYARTMPLKRSLVMARKRSRKQHNARRVREYLRTHPCVDCGEIDDRVLEFDHVRGTKRYEVSAMVSWGWAVIQREIAKCDVRCANCHRRKTASDRGWYMSTQ